eukprot:753088-Hanusia_phi.AAC.12
MSQQPTDVQLFGISLFNTKDPLSERLWNMGSSQGDTITAWPLKAAAWGEVNMCKFNALDYLHDYAARNFEHQNDTWYDVKEEVELEQAMHQTDKAEESEYPQQTIFTLDDLKASMLKKVSLVAHFALHVTCP